ncbi:MAG: replicative DNA helicase [Anaerolineaceae bacterium 4572_78]|nr:MAG: replicative DNA helicase [Anaerolineaceae bacterium 4572_78]
MTVPDRHQPHDVEAEIAVLGALLIDPESIIRVFTFLKAHDFFLQKHSLIYEAILTLYQSRKPTDFITLTDELKRQEHLDDIGGPAYLIDLSKATPTSINVEYYGQIVARTGLLRQLIGGATQIAKLAYEYDGDDSDEVLDQAESIIFNISSHSARQGLSPIREAINKYYDHLEQLIQRPEGIVGLSTGLTDLNKLLGGFQKSDLIILAGRPSMGKTSLCLSIAIHAARFHQKRIAIFSLEMSDEQLVQRFISSETGIDSQRLRLGEIYDNEWDVFNQACGNLSESAIFLDDTPAISVMQLRSEARRIESEYGLDMVIIDYLQLMQGDKRSENRQQEISYISRSLKELARELDVPMLALSQLNRGVDSRADKRPLLSDLRESGSLEQDADVVMFIYRDEVYNTETEEPNIAEIIVSKHRSGPTGVIKVFFKRQFAQFLDLNTQPQALDY